jgi:hypothetical protein
MTDDWLRKISFLGLTDVFGLCFRRCSVLLSEPGFCVWGLVPEKLEGV